MTETLPTTLLASFTDFLAAQMGLYFPSNRWSDLVRGMRTVARNTGFQEPGACIEWLLSSPLTKSQIEALASQLTVGETYFFREKQAFQALEGEVLPALIRARAAQRVLRVWSAGCATGEEPYSLAILLARIIPNITEWNISILATDINPHSLQKASEAVYSSWSFRDCPAEIAQVYFEKVDDGHWALSPEIRKMVSFSYLNLVEDVYPSLLNETNALDLILCRNVLMYFALDQTKRVIQRFHRCLLEGSWLVVSATEASHILYSRFGTVNFPGAILYRKGAAKVAVSREPEAPGSDILSLLPAEPLAPVPSQHRLATLGQKVPESAPAISACAEAETEANPPLPSDPFKQYEEGRYSEAERSVAAWLEHRPGDVKAMALHARILANLGQLTEALEWCDRAIAAEKLDPTFHYLRATILQEQGGTREAADSLKRALYLDHRFVLAHFALGNLHRSMGKPREAEKQFQNTLSLLKEYQQDELLSESEGITAGRLREIIGHL